MLILTQLMAQGGFVFRILCAYAFCVHVSSATQGGGNKQQIVTVEYHHVVSDSMGCSISARPTAVHT